MRPALFAMVLAALLGVVAGCTGRTGGPDPRDTDDEPELAELVGILVTPERVTLPLGEQVQLRATGLRADRTSSDLTYVVSWESSDPSTVEISDALDNEGIARGLQTGDVTVAARLGEIASPPARVRVTEAALIGLTVQPSTVTIEQGRTVQLQAEAGFSDGTRSDASSQALWITDDPAVVTLAAGGRLTASGAGATTVRAQWGEVVSAPVPVEVKARASAELTITRATAEVGGGYLTLSVTSANLGEVGAADFWLDVFVDPPAAPGPGDLGVDFRRITWLGAGENRRTTFQFPIDPGDHTIVVVIDIEREVDERDETNNQTSVAVSVSPDSVGGPNLTIPYFDYVADAGADMVLYALEVENTGTVAAGPFYVDLWTHSVEDPTPSGVGDAFVRVEGLGPGEIEPADFFFVDFTDLSGCDYCWSWAMADTNAEVDETDETDNVIGPLEVEL